MRSLIKKVLAVALIIITVSGSLFSIKGFGEREGVAGRMRLGLDMVGGVSVLMEAQTDLTGGELAAMMEQVRAVMENRVNEFGLWNRSSRWKERRASVSTCPAHKMPPQRSR